MATETTKKAPNYTVEQSAAIIEAYQASPMPETVKALATTYGKTIASVIAKLARAGVYVKPAKEESAGEGAKAKQDLAGAIGAVLSMTAGEIASLTKANKGALEKIFKALAESKPIEA